MNFKETKMYFSHQRSQSTLSDNVTAFPDHTHNSIANMDGAVAIEPKCLVVCTCVLRVVVDRRQWLAAARIFYGNVHVVIQHITT